MVANEKGNTSRETTKQADPTKQCEEVSIAESVQHKMNEKRQEYITLQAIISKIEDDIEKYREDLTLLTIKLSNNPEFSFLKDEINNIKKMLFQLEKQVNTEKEKANRVSYEITQLECESERNLMMWLLLKVK